MKKDTMKENYQMYLLRNAVTMNCSNYELRLNMKQGFSVF